MSAGNIKIKYYQSEIHRIEGEIKSYDEIISDAQERKRIAAEHRELLFSLIGGKEKNPSKAFHELSMREAVRQSLVESPLGLRPKEIVQYMLSRGYDYTGTTIINTRVSNELKHLMDASLVRKIDSNYYAGGGAT